MGWGPNHSISALVPEGVLAVSRQCSADFLCNHHDHLIAFATCYIFTRPHYQLEISTALQFIKMPRAVRGMCTLLLPSLAIELTCASNRSPDRMRSVRESHYFEVWRRKTRLHCGGPGRWPPPGYQGKPTAEPEDPVGKGMPQKTTWLCYSTDDIT